MISQNVKKYQKQECIPYCPLFTVQWGSLSGGSLSGGVSVQGVSVWGGPCLETGHMISVTNEKCHYIGIPVYVAHQYRQVFVGSQSPLKSLGLRHCTI